MKADTPLLAGLIFILDLASVARIYGSPQVHQYESAHSERNFMRDKENTMMSELIALLFFSRDYGHKAHLATRSHAQHVTLDAFYKELTELLDELAEAAQGKFGILDIPSIEDEVDILKPVSTLESHLKIIEGVRDEATENDSALQNILDEICQVYLAAIYKLQYLQ